MLRVRRERYHLRALYARVPTLHNLRACLHSKGLCATWALLWPRACALECVGRRRAKMNKDFVRQCGEVRMQTYCVRWGLPARVREMRSEKLGRRSCAAR